MIRESTGWPGPGWYPDRLEEGFLRWVFVGNAAFGEPFFEDTLRRHAVRSQGFVRTPVEVLADLQAAAPAALVFHSSRCGSTLLMGMLGTLPGVRAAAEPPVLDALLARALRRGAEEEDLRLIRGLAAVLGGLQEGVNHLVIKQDSWHVAAAGVMRRCFPLTRGFFLHRDPAGVLGSHLREPGSQMVPGLVDSVFRGPRTGEVPVWDLQGYAAAVLEGIFAAAEEQCLGGWLEPLRWEDLPDAISREWLEKLGIAAAGEDFARMRERALRHSKRPQQSWSPAAPSGPDRDMDSVREDIREAVLRMRAIRQRIG